MSDTKLQAQLAACQKRVALLEAELAAEKARPRPKVRIRKTVSDDHFWICVFAADGRLRCLRDDLVSEAHARDWAEAHGFEVAESKGEPKPDAKERPRFDEPVWGEPNDPDA